MNTMTTESGQKLPFTSADWEKLRYQLQDSMLAKTNLFKLAKDMGAKWPIRGKDETAEKYISHTLEQLADMPEFYGKGNRLLLLYSILRDTLTLDDPFSDMVSHFDAVAEQEQEALMALQQLEVPADFPVELTNLSPDTLNLCRAEQITDLALFVTFAQQSAKSVIINGDYRRLLNALMEMDIKVLKQFVPVREGEPGLFLAEFIGHMASRLTDSEAASLFQAYQLSTTKAAWSPERALGRTHTLALIEDLKVSAAKRFALMPDQAQQLRHAVESGEAACVRFFITLRDPDLESLAIAISMAAHDIKPRFKGLIGRFLP